MWYLREVRKWMDAHPHELLRMRVSRHAGDTFPGTPDAALQSFFADFVELFGDVLHDHTRYPSVDTTLAELVRNKQRLHVSLAAYDIMTSNGTAKGSNLVNEGIDIRQCGSYPDLTVGFQSCGRRGMREIDQIDHRRLLTEDRLQLQRPLAPFAAIGATHG